MSYDRYEAADNSVKDFEKKLEDVITKCEELKTERLQNVNHNTSIETLKKEVQGMIPERQRVSNQLDQLLKRSNHILCREDIKKYNELKSRLDKAFFELVKNVKEVKEELNLIKGWEAK